MDWTLFEGRLKTYWAEYRRAALDANLVRLDRTGRWRDEAEAALDRYFAELEKSISEYPFSK